MFNAIKLLLVVKCLSLNLFLIEFLNIVRLSILEKFVHVGV